jgi:LCP family protein required for cell wall assembly
MNRFEFLKKIKLPKVGRPTGRQIIFWGLTAVLGIGTFLFARGFTTCWQLTELPGRAPASCGESLNDPEGGFQVNEQGTPVALPPTPFAAPEAALPPAWDGASRINILLLGLDERDLVTNEGPPRSDTMMLVTIDPVSKTAGMLSIPRDMWVNIPGFGYSRINTAYATGEGNALPGGGAGLAMRTVSQFIGVPVDYYVQIDFNTFTDLMNRIGCLELETDYKLILDPPGPGMDKTVLTPGGLRNVCSWQILAFARNRKTEGGDFDRAKRQQQVIYALQKKIFNPEVFPSLLAQAPQMYAELSNGIHTNMSFEDAIKLAVLVKDIPRDSIKAGVIDTSMVTFDNVILGGQDASIMKPISDKIRVLRDEIFTTGGAVSPLAQGDPASLMRAEEARVRIVDGTFTPGLDQRAGVFFQSQGMNVTEVGPSPEVYSSTVIVVYGPKLYTVRYMQAMFGIPANQIRFSPDPASSVDIEIRLGSDIAGSIP